MMGVNAIKNAEQAEKYFLEYYADGQEQPGVWGGRGAAMLGLTGAVEKDAFMNLARGFSPDGEQLTQRIKTDRIPAYDFTFSAPKSVSLVGLLEDSRVIDAFQESVRYTMQQIEQEAAFTRVRKGAKNRDENRLVSNMVWSDFTHFTARPVSGLEDPDLHMHVVAMNLAKDEIEGGIWKALQVREAKHHYFEKIFHNRLARNLVELGYSITLNPHNFEISSVSRELVQKFSRRTQEIEAYAEDHNITQPEAKALIGRMIRQNKQKERPLSELVTVWRGSLSEGEREQLTLAPGGVASVAGAVEKEKAIGLVMDHVFERASVVEDRQVLAEALRLSLGRYGEQELKDALYKSPGLVVRPVGDRSYITTEQTILDEKTILRLAKEGRGACKKFAYAPWEFSNSLNQDQKDAVKHILSSQDKITLVQGGAGTGKTTLMQETAKAIKENTGLEVFAFAPTAKASRDVLRKEGFSKADTLQMLLTSQELQQSVAGGVLWIDEAGLVSAKQMKNTLQLAKKLDCRVILSGDSRQHSSVEAGDSLRLLEKYSGLQMATLKAVVRQSGFYRDAVEQISLGNMEKGVDILDRKLHAVKEIADKSERIAALVSDYLRAVEERKTALVVSPTHKEANLVTAGIREGLKERGLLAGDEKEVLRLVSLNYTNAQKQHFANYEPGQVIEFSQNTKGVFKMGARFYVISVDDKGKIGLCSNPKAKTPTHFLPLNAPERFNVYQADQLPLTVNDEIRITKGGKDYDGQRLSNGAVYRVTGFTKGGHIKLNNGRMLDKEFGFLSHAYATTSHSSQGATVDRVFIAQSAESFAATSKEQFYVSVSRGRESVTIYTDSKEELKQEIQQSSARPLAVEMEQKAMEQINASKLAALRHRVSVLGRLSDRAWSLGRAMSAKAKEKMALVAPSPAAVPAQEKPSFVRRLGYQLQLTDKQDEKSNLSDTLNKGAKSYLEALKPKRASRVADTPDNTIRRPRKRDWGL